MSEEEPLLGKNYPRSNDFTFPVLNQQQKDKLKAIMSSLNRTNINQKKEEFFTLLRDIGVGDLITKDNSINTEVLIKYIKTLFKNNNMKNIKKFQEIFKNLFNKVGVNFSVNERIVTINENVIDLGPKDEGYVVEISHAGGNPERHQKGGEPFTLAVCAFCCFIGLILCIGIDFDVIESGFRGRLPKNFSILCLPFLVVLYPVAYCAGATCSIFNYAKDKVKGYIASVDHYVNDHEGFLGGKLKTARKRFLIKKNRKSKAKKSKKSRK